MGRRSDPRRRARRPQRHPATALLAAILAALTVSPVTAADRDRDGLRDGWEARYGVTSPDSRDSDGDGVIDSAEDNDGDRLGNLGEQRFGTHPGKRDTDGDGKPDGREDHDRDGLTNMRQQDQRPLPRRLRPSLEDAPANAPTQRRACFTKAGEATLKPCPVGPPEGSLTVALVGDSHALMWLPAFEAAAAAAGWRVTGYFKAGCALALGIVNDGQYDTDRGRSCAIWRRRVLDVLAGDPPDLVVLTHFDRYRLVTSKGRRIRAARWPARWEAAYDSTLDRLPGASTVLFMGDVPQNRHDPVKCLKAHRNDISACVSPWRPLARRPVEAAVRRAVSAHGANVRTIYGKVCTYRPCGLVQGDVLMWRDTTHLTRAFTRRLAPSVRAVVEDVMTAPAPARP